MSDRNVSDDSRRQKSTRFATPEAPSELTIKNTCGSPIATARDHVNSHAGTLHKKLAKIVVRCAADFMTRRQNLHYKIASQQNLKSDSEYTPTSTQLQVLAGCQKKLKSLVIEAGDINLVKKRSSPFFFFVESIHDISKGFLTYVT